MTEKREFYAASVEEAVAKAATHLGIEPDALPYRVVDQGNSGFLGIGARDARIEVDAPWETSRDEPVAPEPAAEVLPPEEAAAYGSSLSRDVVSCRDRGARGARIEGDAAWETSRDEPVAPEPVGEVLPSEEVAVYE